MLDGAKDFVHAYMAPHPWYMQSYNQQALSGIPHPVARVSSSSSERPFGQMSPRQ